MHYVLTFEPIQEGLNVNFYATKVALNFKQTCIHVYLFFTVHHESGSKLKSLSDLFKPPFDIMFTGTFEEVNWIL